MASRSRIPQKAAIPLRSLNSAIRLSNEQVTILGLFIAVSIAQEVAVYATAVSNGTAFRLKFWADGESYEDVINPREDLAYLFDDYARQLGFLDSWRQAYATWAARRSEPAAEAPPAAPEGNDTAPTPLRASRARS